MALHEDLRRTHLPPDTLRALLSRQTGRIGDLEGDIPIRWPNVTQILDIMERMGVRANREDLETMLSTAIDVGGTRKTKSLKHDTVLSIWNALSEANNGRLQNISIQVRERWLMYRLRRFRPQAKQKSSESHISKTLKAEWRQLALQGFFQHISLPIHAITFLFGGYHLHIEEVIDTLRVVHDNGGLITREALRSVWWNHLESRLADFDAPDFQTYQYMNQILEADSMTCTDSFDILVREALREAIADNTGGVNAIALLLYLPSESASSSHRLGSGSQPSYAKALHFIRRRIKRVPTQPTEEQAPHIVTTLGFGAVTIRDAIAQGEIVSDYLVLTVFRGFKYLPGWMRTDDRYARRIQSALLLLVRSLRSRDHTLKQWQSVWPTMLETLSGYSSTRELTFQAMSVYCRMRTSKSSTDYAQVLSAFRQEQLRTAPQYDQPRKMLDMPWLAMDLYVDAVRFDARELDGIRNVIVHRLSDMENPVYLRHLRTTASRHRGSDQARPIVLALLHDAIQHCQTPELVTGLYDIASGICTPKDPASMKILDLLLCKMSELGDQEHQQFAISRVEAEYERGVKPSRSGMETLVSLVEDDAGGTNMDDKVGALEVALATGDRLLLKSQQSPDII